MIDLLVMILNVSFPTCNRAKRLNLVMVRFALLGKIQRFPSFVNVRKKITKFEEIAFNETERK